LQIPILNPLETIEWNLNKKHLLELAEKIPVPKTKWRERGTLLSTKMLEQTAAEWQVDQLVIKPAVSLNGHDTYLVPAMEFANMNGTICALLETRDLIIQEFVSEIKTQGETSLIFFNRKYSHAVRKVPAKNEFRVHYEYGGSRDSTAPSPQAVQYSQRVLDLVDGDLLYARVDLVERENGPILIELELTDPMFYLGTDAEAPQNFADAVSEALV
jgi:glutathione synthase/RimK-type ligase-like ATP-grasp enzyme